MTFRGFVAVEVPSTPTLAAFVAELRAASRGLKVVAADQLHLTLKFLGETDEGLIPEIASVIRAACTGIAPFTVRLRGTGAFPGLTRMNVVWVGLEGAGPFARIAAALETGLEPLGFPVERRTWKPHVTIARVKGRQDLDNVRRLIESHASDEFGVHLFDSVHLKRSVLTPQGPVYSVLESVRLGDG
jgi:2'-5' RNA ligase